jgi:DNA-binding GntR family transcriptional regulator
MARTKSSETPVIDRPPQRRVEPILRPSLHDQLLGRLRAMIVEGELLPEAKIDEKELCARFAVSRTPLREALKVLASEGLVTLIAHRGAIVAPLDIEELSAAFPVMGALEALAGELAAKYADDWEIDEVARLQEQLVDMHKAGNLRSYFEVNKMIHEIILNAARNPVLSQIYGQVALKVRRARYTANISPERWAEAIAEHALILKALQARDGKKLATILRAHLDHKFETVRAAMGG